MPPEGSGSQETASSPSENAGQRAIFEQEYDGRVSAQERQAADATDLTLDVPSLGVEELQLDVEKLKARISLHAELADMVKLSVGVEADVDKVKLAAKGVEAQLLLKAGLDNVRDILGQALDALDNNPEILEDLFRSSGQASGGAGRALEGAAPSEDAPAPEADEESSDRSAGEPNATDAARRKAEELGVDLAQIEGTGAGGRILVTDVRKAAG